MITNKADGKEVDVLENMTNIPETNKSIKKVEVLHKYDNKYDINMI